MGKQPQTELLLNVKKELKDKLQMEISLKELPDEGGIYAELGAGYTEKKYIRGPGIYVHPVLFICKDADEQSCLDQLSVICNHFKKCRKPPAGNSYTGRKVQVAAEPNKIGRQENEQVLYSCIVNFEIMY